MTSKSSFLRSVTLCTAALLSTNCFVNADSVSNQASASSVLSNSQKTINLTTYEYNWLHKHTKLKRRAIIGVIAVMYYESGNKANYQKDGKGLLAWNGSASIIVDNTQQAVDSQLAYLKATLNIRGNSLIDNLNDCSSPTDAAVLFEKEYEGNYVFLDKNKSTNAYKKRIHYLNTQVEQIQKEIKSINQHNISATSSSLDDSSKNIKSLHSYLLKNTSLNKNAVTGICAVVLHESNANPLYKSKTGQGFLNWKNKPVPMNGNQKMSQLEQQELYLKDTINPKLANELNRQKDAESAAKTFAKEYCHLKQKVNWMKYVNQVNKEN